MGSLNWPSEREREPGITLVSRELYLGIEVDDALAIAEQVDV